MDIEEVIQSRILEADVELLNELSCKDSIMALMAAEHAARTERLCKMIEPSLGRAVLLIAAGALLEAVKEIDGATFQEPELVPLSI